MEELFPASTAYLGDCMSALIARLLARIAVALVTAVLLRAAYLRVEYPGFSVPDKPGDAHGGGYQDLVFGENFENGARDRG